MLRHNLCRPRLLVVKFLLAQTSFSRQSHGDSTRPKDFGQQPEKERDMSCACVTAVCAHMIATQCASFVGTWDSVHKLWRLVSVIFDPYGLLVIPSVSSKHIDDNFNSYEGISLKQSSRSKLHLSDLGLAFYKISL